MSDEIKNALTPEEWRLLKLWSVGKMVGGKVRGMVVLDLPEDHQHGAAACALYGQSFGFSAADVGALRSVAETERLEGALPGAEARAAAIESVASRIAALLPPEETR